jgi:hypothetical protein
MPFGKALEDISSRNGAKYRQEAQKLSVPLEFNGLHKSSRMSDNSKHLETGIAPVFGLDVDLVNLKEETYTQDSRNPQIKFGTAVKDTFRRDATINALFYNLIMQQIDDFTRNGLQDLATGIVRTPLDPHHTFMDDPLRVLRVIRFASKLGYKINDAAKQSVKDKRMHVALNAKIGYERIGTETIKMMNSQNPLIAFRLIYEMDLSNSVPRSNLPVTSKPNKFASPPTIGPPVPVYLASCLPNSCSIVERQY